MRYFALSAMLLLALMSFAGQPLDITGNATDLGLTQLSGTRSGQSIDFEWSLGERQPVLYSGIKPGTDFIGIEGMESRTPSGHPQIPSETVKHSLPRGARILGIEMTEGVFAYIAGSYNICPKPEQFPRSPEYRGRGTVFNPDMDVYGRNAFYPASPGIAWGGSGRKGGIAVAQVNPLFVNPATGQVAIMQRAKFRIYYDIRPKPVHRAMRTMDTDAENLVIGAWDMGPSARLLVDMHTGRDIISEFISIDSIVAMYEPATPDPSFDYRIPGSTLPSDMFTPYDEDRALRLIAFLQDTDAHPYLRSVTLLGDANVIPPSFYANFGYDYYYDDYMPSDFLYASPDFDLVPDYAVMRIPADSPCFASTMCPRFVNYDSSVRPSDLASIYFTGGNPFDNIYFDDEMTPNHIINDGHIMGFEAVKSYATRGGFNADDFIYAWISSDYGFIYEMGHGDGFDISFDDYSTFGVSELGALPASSFAPVHFAGVCSNGMYDDELIRDVSEEFTYAEAMMYYSGGAIAFFGATRTSAGTPTYYFDGPLLIVDTEEEISAMGYNLVETWNTRPTDFGELMITVQERFVEDENMLLEDNVYCLYEFIGFGDPGLVIPRTTPELMTAPITMEISPHDGTIDDFVYFNEDDPVFAPLNDSPEFRWKRSRVNDGGYVFDEGTITSGAYVTEIIPDYTELRRLDIEDRDRREERLFFYLRGSDMVMDGRDNDWSSIPAAATDENDFAEGWLELTDFYLYGEGDNLYFGWPTGDAYGGHRAYCLAIDSREGGVASIPPSGTDAFDNRVTFGRNIDFQFTANVWAWEGWHWLSADHRFMEWNGSEYGRDRQHLGDFGGEANLNPDGNFMELRIPKDAIDFTDSLAVVLYTVALDWYGETYYPAQDAVPDNPGTFSELSTGHNTLTVFYTYREGESVTEHKPDAVRLITALPNPFNATCRIDIPQGFTAAIYDIHGRQVHSLTPCTSIWNAEGQPSGVYLVNAQKGDVVVEKRVVLVK